MNNPITLRLLATVIFFVATAYIRSVSRGGTVDIPVVAAIAVPLSHNRDYSDYVAGNLSSKRTLVSDDNVNSTGIGTSLSFMLQLSLLPANATLTAQELESRLDVKDALLNATIETLCRSTDFVISDTISYEDSDYCASVRTFVGNADFASIVGARAGFTVTDESSDSLDWTVWSLTFPVLQLGQVYLQSVLENLEISRDAESVSTAAALLMETVAQNALSQSIQSGEFDILLGDDMRSSEVGKEKKTFISLGASDEDTAESMDAIDPAPMNALRITGICMFIFTVVFVVLLMYLSKKKHRQRVLDSESKGIDPGGLNSEQQIEFILEAWPVSSKPNATPQEKVHETASSDDSFITSSSQIP